MFFRAPGISGQGLVTLRHGSPSSAKILSSRMSGEHVERGRCGLSKSGIELEAGSHEAVFPQQAYDRKL